VRALLLILMLAGCAAGAEKATLVPDSPSAATAAGTTLIAEDGIRLPLRVWLPDGKIAAVVVALHGFNDYSNSFTGPAEEWAKHGIATYAYDQRGFGAAPDHGRWVGTWRLAEDLTDASRFVRQRHPGVPLYLLGESMGGAVVITNVTGAAGASPAPCDGIILSAPAVWGRSSMNLFERVGLWTAYHLLPGATLSGRGLHIMPSDNIEMLRGLARDPLVIKETRVDAVKGLVDLMDLAFAAAPHLRTTMLLLYGEHDEVIPAKPMRQLVENLPAAPADARRIAWYPEGYHMLLRDLEAPLVLKDIESWIDDRAAPLPSGADRRTGAFLAAGS
jgi:acylglycerol lipase